MSDNTQKGDDSNQQINQKCRIYFKKFFYKIFIRFQENRL